MGTSAHNCLKPTGFFKVNKNHASNLLGGFLLIALPTVPLPAPKPGHQWRQERRKGNKRVAGPRRCSALLSSQAPAPQLWLISPYWGQSRGCPHASLGSQQQSPSTTPPGWAQQLVVPLLTQTPHPTTLDSKTEALIPCSPGPWAPSQQKEGHGQCVEGHNFECGYRQRQRGLPQGDAAGPELTPAAGAGLFNKASVPAGSHPVNQGHLDSDTQGSCITNSKIQK